MNKRAAPSVAIEAIIMASNSPLTREHIIEQLNAKLITGKRRISSYLHDLVRGHRICRSGSEGSYIYSRPKVAAKASVEVTKPIVKEFQLQAVWRGAFPLIDWEEWQEYEEAA